jgi:hypothetical protein
MGCRPRNPRFSPLQGERLPPPICQNKEVFFMANRIRNRPFSVRLTDGEYALWLKKHKVSGMSKTEYFVKLLKSSVIKVYFFSEVIAELCKELRKIGVNLNQIAVYANSGYFPQAEQEIKNIYPQYSAVMEKLKAFLECPLINARIIESEGE